MSRPQRYPSSRLPSAQGSRWLSVWWSGRATVLPKSIIQTLARPVWSCTKRRELPTTCRERGQRLEGGAGTGSRPLPKRQLGRVLDSMSSGAGLSGFRSRLCRLLARWPWAGDLNLCLPLLAHMQSGNNGIIVHLPQRLLCPSHAGIHPLKALRTPAGIAEGPQREPFPR